MVTIQLMPLFVIDFPIIFCCGNAVTNNEGDANMAVNKKPLVAIVRIIASFLFINIFVVVILRKLHFNYIIYC